MCDIGVNSTSNTLKTLEEHITTLESKDSDDDQCAHKHSRSSMEPSEAEEVGDHYPSRSPSPDTQHQSTEDCVSLGNDDWDLDAMVCNATGLKQFGSVPSHFLMPHTAHK